MTEDVGELRGSPFRRPGFAGKDSAAGRETSIGGSRRHRRRFSSDLNSPCVSLLIESSGVASGPEKLCAGKYSSAEVVGGMCVCHVPTN